MVYNAVRSEALEQAMVRTQRLRRLSFDSNLSPNQWLEYWSTFPGGK